MGTLFITVKRSAIVYLKNMQSLAKIFLCGPCEKKNHAKPHKV